MAAIYNVFHPVDTVQNFLKGAALITAATVFGPRILPNNIIDRVRDMSVSRFLAMGIAAGSASVFLVDYLDSPMVSNALMIAGFFSIVITDRSLPIMALLS